MKNILVTILFIPFILQSQTDPIREKIKQLKFDGKPTKIIMVLPDSINAFTAMGKSLLKNSIPIKNSDRELGMITMDYFLGPYDKDINQNCLVFIEGQKVTVTGKYHMIEPLYKSVLDGDAQGKGGKNSIYRNAFYNLIYIFRDYFDYMRFE